MKVPAEIDFHNHTAMEMRHRLEDIWSRRTWHGLPRVRVIHGKGEVLIPELRKWCAEKGIDWSPEPGNPGATFIYPGRRTLPTSGYGNKITSPELRALRNRMAAQPRASQQQSGQSKSGAHTSARLSAARPPSSRRDLLLDPVGSAGDDQERSVRDDELFEAELERLALEHARGILRNKHGR